MERRVEQAACEILSEVTVADRLACRQFTIAKHQEWLSLAQSLDLSAQRFELEELKLARDGTWDWFQSHGGITDAQALEVVGELPPRPIASMLAKGLVPPRLALLAREAWKKEFYSEGQLARLLQLDRHGMREVLDGAEQEESEANELVKILR